MNISIKGNFIAIKYNANDPTVDIQLPDGYSFETLQVTSNVNIGVIYPEITFVKGSTMHFPPINSKSPCILRPILVDSTKSGEIRILIEKFGQIPDLHYFDKTFDPILVVGDDGKEYNVIPSDQFK